MEKCGICNGDIDFGTEQEIRFVNELLKNSKKAEIYKWYIHIYPICSECGFPVAPALAPFSDIFKEHRADFDAVRDMTFLATLDKSQSAIRCRLYSLGAKMAGVMGDYVLATKACTDVIDECIFSKYNELKNYISCRGADNVNKTKVNAVTDVLKKCIKFASDLKMELYTFLWENKESLGDISFIILADLLVDFGEMGEAQKIVDLISGDSELVKKYEGALNYFNARIVENQ